MTYLNTAMLLEHAAQSSPDQAFILTGTEGFTYNRVNQEANRVANALTGLGIQPGDHIALQLPNVGRMPIILFGCFKLGAVPVMLNVTAPGPEIASLLAASSSVALICSEACVQAALEGFQQVETCQHFLVGDAGRRSSCPAPALNLSTLCSEAATRFSTCSVKADQPAAMLYTSGTTGLPKGIVHSHLNYYFTAVFSAREFWHLGPNDVMLMVAPGSSIFRPGHAHQCLCRRRDGKPAAAFQPRGFFKYHPEPQSHLLCRSSDPGAFYAQFTVGRKNST